MLAVVGLFAAITTVSAEFVAVLALLFLSALVASFIHRCHAALVWLHLRLLDLTCPGKHLSPSVSTQQIDGDECYDDSLCADLGCIERWLFMDFDDFGIAIATVYVLAVCCYMLGLFESH